MKNEYNSNFLENVMRFLRLQFSMLHVHDQ
jgi:hypothetical protein